jgi:hypothetical protein
MYIGDEEFRDVRVPTTMVAKPKKLKEKMRHMERLESDDFLLNKRHGRDEGLSKDKAAELRGMFKLPAMENASRTVQPVKMHVRLLDGTNKGNNVNGGIKDPNKRELFILKGE